MYVRTYVAIWLASTFVSPRQVLRAMERRRRVVQKPKLLRAIELDDTGAIRRALVENPEAASEPFWDHDLEPPLCAAIRCGCRPAIFELLLAHGADASFANIFYQTPVEMLRGDTGPFAAFIRYPADTKRYLTNLLGNYERDASQNL